MSVDLTLSGYGPIPARTLTWTQFWYVWAELYLRKERERREKESYQAWTASLMNMSGNEATARLINMRAQNNETSANIAIMIWQSVPLSVRALLSIPEVSDAISAEADALAFWDEVIAEYSDDPTDKRADFYRGGKKAALQRRGLPN